MNFLTSGEKIQEFRVKLNLKQEELKDEGLTVDVINMIENDKKELDCKTALTIFEKFKKKAEIMDVVLNIDVDYFMRSQNEDAEIYCLNKLKSDDVDESVIEEIFELTDEFDLLAVKAEVYVKIGQLSSKEKDYEKACFNYNKAVKIYKSMGKREKLAYIYLKMGFCKGNGLQYDTAIVYYNLSQYYAFVYDDLEVAKLSLYDLANAYNYLKKIDLSLETIEKYLAIASMTDQYYAYAHILKANCYENEEQFSIAIEIYITLISKILDKENPILGLVYNNLGLTYCNINDFNMGMKYFEMAEKFRYDIDKPNLSHTLIEKSTILLKHKLYDEAIKSVELGLKYAKEYSDVEYLLKGKNILSDIYDKLGNYISLEKIYFELIDLVTTNENNNALKSIYDKLALLYLKENKISLCEKYLVLSKNIN
jgi:tetratricopeptide (TPR) repeat protein